MGKRPSDERAKVAIRSVGFATAQGTSRDLLAGAALSRPVPIPWSLDPRSASSRHRPARGIDSDLTGPARMAALARRALDDCLGSEPLRPDVPVLLASCNGSAHSSDPDLWRSGFELGTAIIGRDLPVASAACASGLHALFLGTRLVEAGADEVVVLAVDVGSAPAHANFETLRILADPEIEIPPWHPGRAGFILGEAAVALRIGRADSDDEETPRLSELALGYDLPEDGGLVRLLALLEPIVPSLVLGQGTGPSAVDRLELAALASVIPAQVPLSTALHHFGHTLGASGLLSVGLAALAYSGSLASALAMPGRSASDGRPLVTGPVSSRETVVVCRALGGACVACVVGPDRSVRRSPMLWRQAAPPPPLRDLNLRGMAQHAMEHRPPQPPDLLLVRLEAPLVPPRDARLADRLLPSSILEMTPGFVAQLVAQTWGFAGSAVCLVANERSELEVSQIVRACQAAGDVVYRVDVRGQEEDRHVDWNC
jgi:Beta-ketoacyl synthase, N-terminal domain